jgi:hypothetical protein
MDGNYLIILGGNCLSPRFTTQVLGLAQLMNKSHRANLLAWLVLLLLTTMNTVAYSQSPKLVGEVFVDLKKKRIAACLEVSPIGTDTFAIALHKRGKLQHILLNGQVLSVKKVKTKNTNCAVYETRQIAFLPTDTLQIKYSISAKSNSWFKNRHDYKGELAVNNGILRASEQAKWLPVFIQKKHLYTDDYAWKPRFSYALTIHALDGSAIFLNEGQVQQGTATFNQKEISEKFLLIVGEFPNTTFGPTQFIGAIPEAERKEISQLIADIKRFYFTFTAIAIDAKFTFAHLPSDNLDWGGFFTYPTFVNVNKTLKTKDLDAFLSHEMAHYYFGNMYQPSGILSLFYTEALAEYFSLKYKIYTQKITTPVDYLQSFDKEKYIRLVDIAKAEDITTAYRYEVGPYLFLELEKRIGEAAMGKFVRELLNTDELNSSSDLIGTTLSKIGIPSKEREALVGEIFNNGTFFK